jgi:hypothetical protein
MSNLAAYAMSAYFLLGLIPLTRMPIEIGPRFTPFLALVVLVLVLQPIWLVVRQVRGTPGINLSEVGLLGLVFDVFRAAPLALWLTFGLNAWAGDEPEVEHLSRVVDVSVLTSVEVQDWRPGTRTFYFQEGKTRRRTFHPGQQVSLRTRIGLLGWEYFSGDIAPRSPAPAPPPAAP